MTLQPWVHELEIAVDGPSTVLGRGDGQVRGPGTGWFVDDRRVVSLLEVDLDGIPAVAVTAQTRGNRSLFWGVARHLGDPTPDPTVDVHRSRTVASHLLTEEIRVASRASETVRATLRLRVAGDGADLADVKSGTRDQPEPLPVEIAASGPSWADVRHRTTVAADREASTQVVDGVAELTWELELAPLESVAITVSIRAERSRPSAFDAGAGSGLCDFADVGVADDPLWDRAVRSNLADLQHLTLTDPESPRDIFAAAGSPWYLTLFGRDSIWAARFMLPFSRALPLGTLRALARRQALEEDVALAAEPGKILHEVRRSAFTGGDLDIPPVYYGTVDATPLWIILLVESWRAGLPEDEVRDLIPTMVRALGWMQQMCARSSDGFLRYVDAAGTGLSNQGWKDSGDSMRRADGTIAPAPIALLEAQAYAVEAALGAADLLDELGGEDGAMWRAWATDLAERVRAGFWVGEGEEAYLAMALDADGRQVDGVGSNMGHALGTGLLTREETDRVVRRLMRPDMLRDFGIATLSADNPAYNPLGYHTGSVWVHDTAIIIHGLLRTGYHEEADQLVAALLRLSFSVDHRFPELIAGDSLGDRPVPYPASCRPQAWSAASVAVMLSARRR